jgi:hypothetical protein
VLKDLKSTLRNGAIAVLSLVHLGLVLGIYALGRASAPNGWDQTAILLLASTLLLYGGFLLGVALIIRLALPWVRRAQSMDHWSERLLRELPQLLEQVPKVVEAVRALRSAWNESEVPATKRTSPPS